MIVVAGHFGFMRHAMAKGFVREPQEIVPG